MHLNTPTRTQPLPATGVGRTMMWTSRSIKRARAACGLPENAGLLPHRDLAFWHALPRLPEFHE